MPAEFYALVLGQHRKYSCCYWPEGVHTLDAAERAAQYEAYSDEVVLEQWGSVLEEGHILTLRNAQWIPDVLIGALAIANGRETLDSYIATLEDSHKKKARDDIRSALRRLATR